jgi:hypothetical protein
MKTMSLKIQYIHDNGYNDWLKEQGFTLEEEAEIYDWNIQDIIENPLVYLKNLEYYREYKVSWKSYSKGLKGSPTPRFRHTKQKAL